MSTDFHNESRERIAGHSLPVVFRELLVRTSDALMSVTLSVGSNDPNNDRYIVELIERVTTVSLETLALVRKLPADLHFIAPNAGRKRALKI